MKRALLAALAVAVPLTAYAAATVTINVSATTMRNLIEDEVESQFDTEVPELRWRPGATRVDLGPGPNDWTSHATLALEYNAGGTRIPVDLDFDVVFDCDRQGVDVYIDDIDTSVGRLVPPATLRRIEDAANEALDARIDAIQKGVWKKLKALDDIPDGLSRVCPTYDVRADGGVKAVMHFDTGCVTHTTKSFGCPAGWKGQGKGLRCVNGKWTTFRNASCYRDVEPAPPGGHVP